MSKKSLFFILTIFLSLFFMCDDVEAYLRGTNTEIECIYGNGVVASLSYDAAQKKYSAYIKEYPAQKTVVIDGDPITNISFYNEDFAAEHLKTLTCPSEIRYWIAWEYTNEENTEKTFRGVYSFDWCATKGANNEKICDEGDQGITQALQTRKSGWWPFAKGEITGGTIPVTGTGLIEQALPDAIIPLIGERLYIVDRISDDTYWHTYKIDVDDEDNQAVGTNKYLQVYNIAGGEAAYQIGSTITTNLNGTSAEVFHSKYLCVKESKIITDASRGDTNKKIIGVKHDVKTSTERGTCSSGYVKYVRTTDVCKINVGTNRESFCDKYTNTAYVLIDIIKIMQILVPALVIILTGIEIGRIVVAGNIEEELPKRKKSMIIRFIVMIAFLFLPVITQLIISLAEGVSILDVSCLFNDGKAVVNETLDEKNCVDVLEEDE